jgi:hypothetical protein
LGWKLRSGNLAMLWACLVTEAMLGLNFYGEIFEGAHNGIG